MIVIKIAVTSSDGSTVDLHFGRTREFYILTINQADSSYQFIEKRKIDTIPEDVSCTGGSEVTLSVLTDLLSDCKYVLTKKVGFAPYKALIKKGISVLESPEDLNSAVFQLCKYLNRKAAPK